MTEKWPQHEKTMKPRNEKLITRLSMVNDKLPVLQNVGRLMKHYQPASFLQRLVQLFVQILKRGFREYCKRLPQVTAAT